MKFFIVVLAACLSFSTAKAQSLSLLFETKLLESATVQLALEDVKQLLDSACHCVVADNDLNADVLIQLPEYSLANQCPPNEFQKNAQVPYFPYPNHDYQWTATMQEKQKVFQLHADCGQGIAFGLYGLLQVHLGFRFYHPKETYIPKWDTIPIALPFSFKAHALFDKKGFHIHTQHPLELTEPLHNPDFKDGFEEVKIYLDWLVRNGQTYFEFNLLEGVSAKKYFPYAQKIVEYGHQRGLIMGIDLSLHMIQQKSFQLYKNFPKSWRSKKKQTINRVKWITDMGWDVLNVEFSTAEFIGGNKKKKELLRLAILEELQNNSKAKLMGRKHVVKDKVERMASDELVMDSAQAQLDKNRGVLIHTVMFYDMKEEHAPVYENQNLQHMFALLQQEKQVRETWYYPESAYWITFDNSIPMLLLPYLNARWNDIQTCVAEDIPGHITFSSGWEWGYWLFDWSIAYWSWKYETNQNTHPSDPLDMVRLLFPQEAHQQVLQEQLDLHQKFLKDKNLIQWLTAMTVTDEMPFGLSQNFHPRPPYFYKDISRNITLQQLADIEQNTLPLLQEFASSSKALCQKMKTMPVETHQKIWNEWTDALNVTALRAAHRAATLQFLLERRKANLKHQKFQDRSLFNQASKIRMEALKLVTQREQNYRYPLSLIARKTKSHTAYSFGYLFPVSQLHFWQREEQQAWHDKWNFRFMKIWDVAKIIGLKN